ncbi:hypothetical protein [Brucella rhizosphaerae]|uniref:Uncharacterized protein n=1 Tax=Brucella rhizosphaerae TaxID=571254 RepID=A0A256FI20_9HYPH|nr:hypothetical protein [Brucella rhizosphaerae]OYR14483.1 hypothetical protein CEV32_0488 [Brucella rhizosphaerae]
MKSRLIGNLIFEADRYCELAGVSRSSVSKALFGRGGHIDDLIAGKRDLSTGIFERAMNWLKEQSCAVSGSNSPDHLPSGEAGARHSSASCAPASITGNAVAP